MKPTLSELEKFEDQPEGIDLEVVTESGEGFLIKLEDSDLKLFKQPAFIYLAVLSTFL